MYKIPDTELIITEEKKIYHLNLSQEEIGDNIILVGDPARVNLVSNKFDNIEHIVENREFKTHTGTVNGKKISVISTGIGTDNIDIVINEIDALVNIDFNKKIIKKKKKSLNIIRLGTSGAIHQSTKVDSFIVSSYALGFDNLAHFYEDKKILNTDITKSFLEKINWPKELGSPYCIKASKHLFDKFSDLEHGITVTAPGFYAPQGRVLRLQTSMKNLHNEISSFNYQEMKIKNFEMETSALYYLGQTLKHNTLTICAIIGNRKSKEYSKNYKATISKLIDLVLHRISK